MPRPKKLGYPDERHPQPFPGRRKRLTFRWSYEMVDTCAAEFDAQTPYFYSTANADCEARSFPRSGKPVMLVLGSGPDPHRSGHRIRLLLVCTACGRCKKLGYDVVMVNNNPETVSTDYDTADRLYFEPLTPEDVMEHHAGGKAHRRGGGLRRADGHSS